MLCIVSVNKLSLGRKKTEAHRSSERFWTFQQCHWNEPRDKSLLSGAWVVSWKEKHYCHLSGSGMGTCSCWHCRSPPFLSSDPLGFSGVGTPELRLLNLALLGAQQIHLPEAGHAMHRDKWQCWAGQAGPNWVSQYPCCKSVCHAGVMQDMTFPLSKSCLWEGLVPKQSGKELSLCWKVETVFEFSLEVTSWPFPEISIFFRSCLEIHRTNPSLSLITYCYVCVTSWQEKRDAEN